MVPTWSIETWVAFLCGDSGVTEDRSLKSIAPYRDRWRDGPTDSASVRLAATQWPGDESLASLADSSIEGARVGLIG